MRVLKVLADFLGDIRMALVLPGRCLMRGGRALGRLGGTLAGACDPAPRDLVHEPGTTHAPDLEEPAIVGCVTVTAFGPPIRVGFGYDELRDRDHHDRGP